MSSKRFLSTGIEEEGYEEENSLEASRQRNANPPDAGRHSCEESLPCRGDYTRCRSDCLSIFYESSHNRFQTWLEVFKKKRPPPHSPSNQLNGKLQQWQTDNYHCGSGIGSSQIEFSVAPHCWCLVPSCPLMSWVLTTLITCSEEAEKTH